MHSVVLRSPAWWWRLLIVLVAIAGFMTGDRHSAYFTSIANTIVLAYYAIAVWWCWDRRTREAPAPVLRGAVVAWIVVVAIIAHIELNHFQFPDLSVTDPSTLLTNWTLVIIHYTIPAMCLVDWIAFGPHGRVRWWHPLVWAAFPVVYLLMTIWRGALFPVIEDAYPYPFLEPAPGETVGGIILGVLPMLPGVIVMCYAVYGLDKASAAVARAWGARAGRRLAA